MKYDNLSRSTVSHSGGVRYTQSQLKMGHVRRTEISSVPDQNHCSRLSETFCGARTHSTRGVRCIEWEPRCSLSLLRQKLIESILITL